MEGKAMRNVVFALLLVSAAVSDVALAQANAEVVTCDTCRDPNLYPDDYVNFAFNQVYGEQGWMDFDQADDFFIENADGQRVYVDVDFVMRGMDIHGFVVPIWPENMLHITIALPNGLVYSAIRSIFQRPLPVPSSSEPGEEEPVRDNDNDNGEGVDDPEGEPDDDPFPDEPEWGPEGTTGIEDPDEDGEFPDPDWCEEC
jgi:hypothetical protein